MERFNPFANVSMTAEDDPDPFGVDFTASSAAVNSPRKKPPPPPPLSHQPASRSDSVSNRYAPVVADSTAATPTTTTNRYSTSFPDPFSELAGGGGGGEEDNTVERQPTKTIATTTRLPLSSIRQDNNNNMTSNTSPSSNRSNSITFAPTSAHSVDESSSYGSPTSRSSAAGRQVGGFTSFLSRATSVTSSSVTDRVSEAVGSVRSAVDSLSTQIQQAVPTNLNERLTTTATSLIGSATGTTTADQLQQQSAQQQQQQSAASYLASKISSATGQFTSSNSGSGSMPVISRQRVILVIESPSSTDWAQQFNNYRRLTSGYTSSSQSALTSFFSSATAQLTAASPSANLEGDLIEQADFRDVSILANQATSTATVLISGTSGRTGSGAALTRVVRPEYVVVRQRTKERSHHLKAIVGALNYCLVPLFEPMEIWNVFQDRQLVFAKLLRVQKRLGRENFPLIPQIYCQTHQDLLNYINSSSVTLPCLIRTGPSGKGKIRIDNLQMLKDFSSIMATSGLSCTIERYLEVKCDLVVQKLGTSLKLFRRNVPLTSDGESNPSLGLDERLGGSFRGNDGILRQASDQQLQQSSRQSATRQTSIGGSVLSSLISSSTSSTNQQLSRQSSNSAASAYEKLADVNMRYRNWIEGIIREFDNKLEAFCLKIAIATNDREYIVGLTDCSFGFLGTPDNQEEDRRSLVELIISNLNTCLPKTHQSTDSQSPQSAGAGRSSSGEALKLAQSLSTATGSQQQPVDCSPLGDKKKFVSQSQINGPFSTSGGTTLRNGQAAYRNYGQLSSRSQSVSMNQSDYLVDETPINKSAFFSRRGSDRSDSLTTTEAEDFSVSQGSQSQLTSNSSAANLHQRQASLGQSLFDQTSTAFNSFQKQSLSFFKRLDARSSTELYSTAPPQSAKSDKAGDRLFISNIADDSTVGGSRNGFKSQSMDSSTLERSGSMRESSLSKRTPPKPPPPQSMSYRQSSLVNHPTQRAGSTTTPHSTPNQTRQNSSVADPSQVSGLDGSSQRGKIARQSSALSDYEKLELAPGSNRTKELGCTDSKAKPFDSSSDSTNLPADKAHKPLDITKKSVNFDSASITSGDSNSTGETTTAEDTMNNLKKTFASIFGDKCE